MKRLLSVFALFTSLGLYSQNAIVGSGFSTGWGGGSCPTGNGNFTYFSGNAGSSFSSGALTPNGSGNQYWRFGVDWGGTTAQLTITHGVDVETFPETEYSLNTGCTASGSMFRNISSTSNRYVFKTQDAGSSPTGNFIFFEIGGDVRTISSVSQSPSGTVYRNQAVVVTASMSGALNSGQGVYLRYSTNNFSTSTITEMTWASGLDYTATIPAAINAAGENITYYVFTSGDGMTISPAKADFYTINLNNNGGSNYSYAVNSSFTTAATGSWSTTTNWPNSVLPSTGSSVVLQHDITLDANVELASLTIPTGVTFTASDGSARTLTISRSASGSATTITNSGGTWYNGSGGSTVVFSGSPTSGDAIHQTLGDLDFQNVTIESSGDDNVGVDFQANSSVSGTLEIGSGGFVSTSPPSLFYGSSATLAFNQGAGAEYDVGSGDNSWSTTQVPSNITISSGTVNLNDDRDATGALNISSGATLNIAAGKTLTLGAISTNGGDLFLKANSSGYAQLDLHDNTTLSNVTAEQYFDVSSGGRWVYMSTPVTTTTTNLLNPAFSIINYSGHSSPSIYRYDGSNYSAISSGTTLNKGDGFMIYAGTNSAGGYVFSAGTFTLSTSKGEITNQDVAISCTNSGAGSSPSGYNGATDGWNLVGNPFPQGLTAASIANANTTFFDGTIYGFDGSNFVPETRTGVGSFNVARPFQSFWVRKTSSGTSNYTLGFANASTDAASFTKTNTQVPLITFSTTWQNGYVADNFVGFSSTATDAFDNQEDAFFLNAQTQGYANLFSFSSADEGLQIDMRNEQFQSKSIEMGFDSETNGTYSIAFAVEHIPSSWTLQLEDRLTNSLHDLNAGAYDFQHSSGNVLKRFVLHINKNAVGQEEAAEMENFYWFQKDQLLTVDGLSLKSPTAVLLTDMMGRQVAFRNLSAGTQRVELNVSGLNSGVYLLQLGNRTAKIVLH